MRGSRIYLLLLICSAFCNPASGQQDTAPNAKKPETQIGNVDLPASTEHWLAPTDIKTGLEPLPPVIVQSDEQPDFVRELIRVQWRPNDPIEVWLVRPKIDGKVPEKTPVIMYLYGFPDNSERFRDNGWCKRATADGFAAVSFIAALTDYRFHDRPLKQWFVSELAESLGSTTHDVQLILNYLATRGDLDVTHVGMFGMGSGGTIAILAAQADDRITTIDLLDPWGDWPDWLKDSPFLKHEEDRSKYVSKEFLQSLSTLDPVPSLAALRAPNIRLQLILSEPNTPRTAKDMMAAAAPLRAVVVKYQSPVDLLNSWKTSGLSGWIKQQMRPAPKNSVEDHRVAKSVAKN